MICCVTAVGSAGAGWLQIGVICASSWLISAIDAADSFPADANVLAVCNAPAYARHAFEYVVCIWGAVAVVEHAAIQIEHQIAKKLRYFFISVPPVECYWDCFLNPLLSLEVAVSKAAVCRSIPCHCGAWGTVSNKPTRPQELPPIKFLPRIPKLGS